MVPWKILLGAQCGAGEMRMTGAYITDELGEKCAVFGVFNVAEASRVAFYGLWALQHRGQESSGIVSSDGTRLFRHASSGLVANVYREEDLEQLAGTMAIGHNRYATSGGAEDMHTQPILRREHAFALAHNGNLPTTADLASFLDARAVDYSKLNDSGMMTEAISCYIDEGQKLEDAIAAAYPLFTGVFSVVVLSADKLVAFRDPCGIRPLALGTLGDGYVIASESCAFDTVGATFLREVKPGEMIIIDKHGLHARQLVPGTQKLDIFEFVYFARPDSNLLGKNVNIVRQYFGRELAKEFPLSADMVIPVPDSAIPAAQGYAETSGIPFEMALIKNRYIHRTFIRPTAELRERDVRMKLNPIPEVIRGKRVIIIDDSIVRGTTTRKIVGMLYAAGAKEVHILISSPPVKYPDFYGINTPNQHDLIAAEMSVEEIRQHLGADSLGYLSYDGMIRATGLPADIFSTSCFNGIYPISIGKRVADFVTV
jgi:amidophosphoribosyltransferase